MGFLAFYLQYFGEGRHLYVDLMPEDTEHCRGRSHLGLEQKRHLAPEILAQSFDKYVHICWCNPELIYADDKRGNEVWLHKRAQ